jgi:tRNA threonylcarbamoyladenosine biosynthesis protein TsaB
MAHIPKNFQQEHKKPLLLALENSTLCGSVALVSGSQCLAEFTLQSRLTHSKRLLSAVDNIMSSCEVKWDDLDSIAVSLGPGSFTGLRICLATAKGLAMAAALPLIGVASLDGLAVQLSYTRHLICVLLDARKKEVYAAFYRHINGTAERISDYLAISPEKLAAQINEPVILVGDGAELYADFFREKLGERALFAPPQLFHTRAAAIGLPAIKKWQNNDFLDTSSAVPIYVRPSDAEIHFKGN